MRHLLLISLATIPLTGCQFFNRDAVVIEPPAEGDVAASSDGEGEAFSEPTVEAAPTVATANGGAVADLISSTDPATRTRQVTRSRPDPFAALPIPPTPDPAVSPVAAAGNGGASTANSGGTTGNASASSRSGGRSSSTSTALRRMPTPPPVRVQPNNAPLVRPSPIAALPSIPQPVIAQTVSVSGVIQMGNEPYAIVRAGNEPERYVRVGDRIAGGSVRVKRIETLAFEPRVILEENGIEVSRPIAAGGGSETGAASPAVSPNALPVPPAAVPGAQATLPTTLMPQSSIQGAIPSSLLLPSAGEWIPGSLLIQSADTPAQAVLPNLQIVVSQAV